MIKIISFLGADGSGKSTLLKMLENDLKLNIPKVKTRVVHFKPAIRKKSTGGVVSPYNKNPHNIFISVAKLFIWCCEYISFFIVIYMKNISTYLIIIFDRHLIDIKVDPLRYRMNETVSKLPFYTFLFPKPDIIFYIDAEPGTINKRKNEVSLDETKQQVKMYRDVLKKIKNVMIIDNEQSVENCYMIIRNKVLENIKIDNITNT
jgi:thymidylate kinase